VRQYSTNYGATFIEVAEDCSATTAEAPPVKAPKTAAQIEYEMLASSSDLKHLKAMRSTKK